MFVLGFVISYFMTLYSFCYYFLAASAAPAVLKQNTLLAIIKLLGELYEVVRILDSSYLK